MDDCRFDNWTRLFAGEATRRTAVKGLTGGAAAVALLARAQLGLAQEGDDVALEANCRGNGAKCSANRNCCSKKCNKKGKCVCAGQGAACKRDNGCCSGVCRDTQCKCGDKGDFCQNDADCCSRICREGNCRCAKQGDRCKDNNACCSNSCSGGFCN